MKLPYPLPEELYRAEELRAMDRHAIEKQGIPGAELMRRAGAAAFKLMRERWPEARYISVLCGAGNNGGDGYVLARLAHEAGLDVRIYPLAPLDRLRGDTLTAYQDYRTAGGEVLGFVPQNFEHAQVLIDGLFGTGLDREVEGLQAEAIRAANRFSGRILALDIPSGLHADTGSVLGVAIRADATISFIGLKRGLFTGEGQEYAGDVVFDDLATPLPVRRCVPPSARLLGRHVHGLPRRPRHAHKGNYGHVLAVGGDQGYGGAVRMAAEAAARVGAGLVSIATRPEHAGLLNLTRPELMCHGIHERAELEHLLERAGVVVMGPGLGRSEWARMLFNAVLASSLPVVLDADALNLLAEGPERREHWILTPHPGEAARMLGVSTSVIQRDRFAAVQELQRCYGGVIVLKGSGSLICAEDGLPWVSAAGNPGMASGGMGDVLAGVLAGLLAQGLEPAEATNFGVRLHGAAGDEAAEAGERGLLAGDLMEPLRRLVNL